MPGAPPLARPRLRPWSEFSSQTLDAFLLSLVVGAALGLKGGSAILEELFLPAVENPGLQAQFLTQLGNRNLVE
jgi:hypothetical protein